MCFLQLVNKQYPLTAVRTLKEEKEKKKKYIPLRENLLGSTMPFPSPIQFFVLGAINPIGRPRKKGLITSIKTEPGKDRYVYMRLPITQHYPLTVHGVPHREDRH